MTAGEPILHVDMDAFYASVEAVKDPSLRGKPVIVGGLGGRGVVTSASYEARAFGVHSAMPAVTAGRLCPHALWRANDFSSYQDFAVRIKEVFSSFSPLVESLSLDEAFIDVSGSVKLFGPPVAIARLIKGRIRDLGLACTVGVAPNKFLAKLASARAKPDGLLVVEAGAEQAFLDPLPVTALWGVGRQTGETLRKLGLKTVRDVGAIPRRSLERAVGDALGNHLSRLARGLDDRRVVPDGTVKQVGSEETYPRDLDSTAEMLREVLRLADRSAARLRAKGLCGRSITLKVRYSNFTTITRAKTLDHEVDTAAEIYEVARSLFERLGGGAVRIRLLGVAVGGLARGPARRQLDLLEDSGRPGQHEAARAIDSIRNRFGEGSVGPATLLDGLEE